MTRETAAEVRAKLTGTIKTLKKPEGYGFITHSATGTDHFFHRSELKNSPIPFEELVQDQLVEFVPVEGPKGLRAMDVRPV